MSLAARAHSTGVRKQRDVPTPLGPNPTKYSVTLKPNEGAEIKLEMKKGAKATYSWAVSGGGNVNYDMHGEPHNAPPKSSHSYKTGRSAESDKGVLEAKFDGNHGWFWRNRSAKEVTVTVRAEGEFSAMKRVL